MLDANAKYGWPGRVPVTTLLLEVANAAGLFADARFERLLGSWLFRSRLWETVVDGDEVAFPRARDHVIGALTDRVFFQLQLPDIGTDPSTTFVGREISIGQAEAEDEKVAVAEVLVFLVVEGLQRRVLVGLERGNGAIEHGPRFLCGGELLGAKHRDAR